jgi:hypothetical protein
MCCSFDGDEKGLGRKQWRLKSNCFPFDICLERHGSTMKKLSIVTKIFLGIKSGRPARKA